jgi:hypothetical protein
MREKLYDLKAQYITIYDDGTVVMKDIDEYKSSYPAKRLDNIEELRGGIDALYPPEKEITYE